ncbi:MAG: hypothetical protein PHC75_07705, partial [Burkholderiales bacterium]|nr:hypothetical protein [Burkholderiales bacterium]
MSIINNASANVKKLRLPLLSLLLLSLTNCGGSCGPNNALKPLNLNLQLDYVGTVPVLNGNATSSYFYIHNDGDTEVSGISYTLAGASTGYASKRLNTLKNSKVKLGDANDVVDANGFVLDGASLANCSKIAAHSFCKINFTTPSLSAGNQNNSLFK